MISGVCFPWKEEVMKELDNLLSVGVPKSPIFGGVTLLYMSIDCLKKRKKKPNLNDHVG